jgi:hypothetical protein
MQGIAVNLAGPRWSPLFSRMPFHSLRDLEWIDAGSLSPSAFVAGVMSSTVGTAERTANLSLDFQAQSTCCTNRR